MRPIDINENTKAIHQRKNNPPNKISLFREQLNNPSAKQTKKPAEIST